MINIKWANYYCCEDISLIENYEAAVNDMTQVWDCHHRVEIMPYGTYSKQNLIDNGLYWHVPAAQLIFLTPKEHRQLHMKGVPKSKDTRAKMRDAKSGANNPFFGKHLSEEHKQKLSAAHTGHEVTADTREKIGAAKKGMKFWNNGEINIRAKECPPGFVPGRLKN